MLAPFPRLDEALHRPCRAARILLAAEDFLRSLVGQRFAVRPIRVTTGANVAHGRGFVKVLCAGVPQHLLRLRPAWAVVHCAAATPTKGSKR